MARTLLDLAGAAAEPAALGDAALLLIDIQNEYFEGPLRLSGVEEATRTAARLLERARALGRPVIHIRHRGRPGGAFDPGEPRGQIHVSVAPVEGEHVIEKTLPNAFAGTALAETLEALGRPPLIVAGFMTHMCVAATVKAALDLGLRSTVVIDATASRDLPDPTGGVMAAELVHRAALAALADRFAAVCRAVELPD